MNIKNKSFCEICHKPKSVGSHVSCSKQKQKEALAREKLKKPKKPKKKAKIYTEGGRKLDNFLKTFGE